MTDIVLEKELKALHLDLHTDNRKRGREKEREEEGETCI